MCKCEEQLDLLMKLLKVSDDRLLMEHVTEYEALSLSAMNHGSFTSVLQF